MTQSIHPPYSKTYQEIDARTLLSRQLENPQQELNTLEKIALLLKCIHGGSRGDGAREPSILLIGPTGAGKSTLINYLAGCEMERQEETESIRVSPSSLIEERVKIGQSTTSETLFPKLINIQSQRIWDCPGFLDNRGAEITIGNAVSIRRIIRGSQSLRLVILMDFNSLDAVKGDGFKKTIEIVKHLFGNEHSFDNNKNSLLFGVTKIPLLTVGEDRSPLDRLKWSMKRHAEYLDSFGKRVIHAFLSQLFVCHPIEQEVGQLRYSGALSKEDLFNRIEHLQLIRNPDIFNLSLTDSDKRYLYNLFEKITASIIDSVKNGQYEDATFMIGLARELHQVDHPKVQDLFEKTRKDLANYFKGLVDQVYQELAQNPNTLSPQAESYLEIVDSGVRAFDARDISEEEIGLKKLKEVFAQKNKRVAFFQEQQQLSTLRRQFGEACFSGDFEKAEKLLLEIKTKISYVEKTFKEFDPNLSVAVEFLETQLKSSQELKIGLQEKESELKNIKDEYETKIKKITKEEKAANEQLKKEMQIQKQRINQLNEQIAQINVQQQGEEGDFFGSMFMRIGTNILGAFGSYIEKTVIGWIPKT